MKKITELTDKQKSMFHYYIDKWIAIGLSTKRPDKAKAEAAFTELYKKINLPQPKFFWLQDPLEGSKASYYYHNEQLDKALTQEELENTLKTLPLNKGMDLMGTIRSYWWCGYAAWGDFFNIECNVKMDRQLIDCLEDFDYCYCFEDVCFLTEKPIRISLDTNKRLHNFTQKALEYRSGWGIYYIHDVKVPEFVVLNPSSITKEIIDAENNAEVRRIMIDIFGEAQYMMKSNFEILDKDIDQFGQPRELLRVKVQGDEDIVKVKVINSSKELDETYKTYFLPVDPELRPILVDPNKLTERQKTLPREELIKEKILGNSQEFTCHNAVASTFGKYGPEYGIEGQTRQGDVLVEFKDGSNNRPFRES